MFAVKMLAIIIMLQTLHNSLCFPYGGPSTEGTSRAPRVLSPKRSATDQPIPAPRTRSPVTRQIAMEVPEQMVVFHSENTE